MYITKCMVVEKKIEGLVKTVFAKKVERRNINMGKGGKNTNAVGKEKEDDNIFDKNNNFQDFDNILLDVRLRKALLFLFKYVYPTKIQKLAIPYILKGNDVILNSKTGSGKTMAYLIPVVQNLIKFNINEKEHLKFFYKCIIISPTEELCLQIYDVVEKLCTYVKTIVTVNHNVNKSFYEDPTILVTTPKLLCNYKKKKKKKKNQDILSNLKILILDEADILHTYEFQKPINALTHHYLSKSFAKKYQVIMASATLKKTISYSTSFFLHNPFYLTTEGGEMLDCKSHLAKGDKSRNTSDNVTTDAANDLGVDKRKDHCSQNNIPQMVTPTFRGMSFYYLYDDEVTKYIYLYFLINNKNIKYKSIIFTRTIGDAYKIKIFLTYLNISSAVLNPHHSILIKQNVILAFNSSKFYFLICPQFHKKKLKNFKGGDHNTELEHIQGEDLDLIEDAETGVTFPEEEDDFDSDYGVNELASREEEKIAGGETNDKEEKIADGETNDKEEKIADGETNDKEEKIADGETNDKEEKIADGETNDKEEKIAGGETNDKEEKIADGETNDKEEKIAGGETNDKEEKIADGETNDKEEKIAGGETNDKEEKIADGETNDKEEKIAGGETNDKEEKIADGETNDKEEKIAGGETNDKEEKIADGEAIPDEKNDVDSDSQSESSYMSEDSNEERDFLYNRGLDFKSVTCVVNFDMPEDKETFIHRIGRTGRLNKIGTIISLVNEKKEEEKNIINRIKKENICIMSRKNIHPNKIEAFRYRVESTLGKCTYKRIKFLIQKELLYQSLKSSQLKEFFTLHVNEKKNINKIVKTFNDKIIPYKLIKDRNQSIFLSKSNKINNSNSNYNSNSNNNNNNIQDRNKNKNKQQREPLVQKYKGGFIITQKGYEDQLRKEPENEVADPFKLPALCGKRLRHYMFNKYVKHNINPREVKDFSNKKRKKNNKY
ncbi:ATP-dependent RNA helicase DBP9, putative [Plasmodium ovale]|uniref:ATP-dependent RNA helicase DBP9, putative n=1 Tax=Plasmodium ovale TaxID=36330 RepID=A0A1C3L5V1_PLAOA|nr:ATP-dependent RNA helicase DBP9, putative [Plasmodium ovale]